jgi:threonine/homoserine/homoserine lactone efflux protein
MPSWSTLSLFITTASILVFMPGPNTLYIIARSIQQGRIAGIISSLGVQTGTWFHIVTAAFGVSALLLTSAIAFNVVKYAGAAYLIYIGVKTFLSRREKAGPEQIKPDKWSRIFYQGILVQLLNPKTALFFFSFLPQFVDVEKGAVSTQILFLGGVLLVLGSTSDLIYALLAGGVGHVLRGNSKFLRAQRYFAGSIYIGLGLTAALTGTTRR